MRICVIGGGRRRLASAAIGAPALALAAFAGSASAAVAPATISVDKACYVLTGTPPSMTVTGSGFQAGAPVTITDGTGTVDTETTPNAAGQITATIPAPTPNFTRPSQKKDTITADEAAPSGTEIKGTTTTHVTAFGAEHGATKKLPGLRALSEKTSWSFSGFPVGKTIWGHYTIKGKQVARQAFGKATAPCGLLTVRRRLYPAAPRHRSYPLQLDSVKKYSKKTHPRLTQLKVSLDLVF